MTKFLLAILVVVTPGAALLTGLAYAFVPALRPAVLSVLSAARSAVTSRWFWLAAAAISAAVMAYGLAAPYFRPRLVVPPSVVENERKDTEARKVIESATRSIEALSKEAGQKKAAAAQKLREADSAAARNKELAADTAELERRRGDAPRPRTLDEALAGLKAKGY